MTDQSVSQAVTKPLEGSVAPVEVANWYKHPLVLITSLAASIPLVLGALIQLQQIPGLPTNVMAWIAGGISTLTAILTILRALGLLGSPVITPTAASKLIQIDPGEKA